MRRRKRINVGIPHIVAILLIITAVAAIVWAQTTLRITIIGDSTVCNYGASKYPQTGWGQVLHLFFAPGSVTINNRAIGGRSTRSFYQEGRWAEIVPNLQTGEYVFIQFGHNDRDYSKAERYTDTTDYKEYLRKYVKESRAKGAVPVLISPMNMNAWNGSTVRTVFREGANNYRGAMMNVAEELTVPFIDLEQKSVALQKRMGQEYCAKFIYFGLDANEYPNFPGGMSDGTHFQEMGANFMAKFVCEGIDELKTDPDIAKLAALLKPQFTMGVSANKSNIGMITEDGNTFPEGVSITVKVRPKAEERFLGWFDASGQKATGEKRYVFTMPSKDVVHVARFEGGVQQYMLSTTVAEGEGTIAPATGSFDEGSTVSVTAVPTPGWLFDRWEGGVSSNENPVDITMNDNMALTAFFTVDTANYFLVSATTTGGGFVQQDPPGISLAEGTKVTITAVPLEGWRFTGWNGTWTGTDAEYTINRVNSDVTLNAGFIPVDATVYEAEYGVMNAAVTEKVNEGFSGTGYVNFNNETGSSVEIPVYAFEAGEKTVVVSYANGSATSRQASVLLNDSVAFDNLEFTATGDWNSWEEKNVSLTLKKGVNVIRIVSVSAEGGPNIDKIGIDQLAAVSPSEKKVLSDIRITQLHAAIRFDNVEEPFRIDIFSIDGRRITGSSVKPLNGAATFKISGYSLKQGQYILRMTVRERQVVSRFNLVK